VPLKIAAPGTLQADRQPVLGWYHDPVIELARFLHWHDVVSRGLSFDASAARSVAEALVSRAAASQVANRDELEAEIDRALVADYGAWAAGWNWAASEPGGGGQRFEPGAALATACCARMKSGPRRR
jgi:hypothetical protein